jgi:hypothetical protein
MWIQFSRKFQKREDGHQRELLKVLAKMDLSEDQEGVLFDAALDNLGRDS